jgi:hypothetical protein
MIYLSDANAKLRRHKAEVKFIIRKAPGADVRGLVNRFLFQVANNLLCNALNIQQDKTGRHK